MRRRVRIRRRTAVLTVLAGGAVLLVVSLLTWAQGSAALTVGGTTPVQVTGSQGAAVVPSAALVALAAGLAIGLAGRIARTIAAVAVALAGLLALIATIAFLGNPTPALLRAAGEVSGVPEISDAISITPWPVVALVAAAALTLTGAVLPLVMGTWQRVGARYERPDTPAGRASGQEGPQSSHPGGGPEPGSARQRISDWDALSRGEDPSDPEDR